jgi:hypothetical protein
LVEWLWDTLYMCPGSILYTFKDTIQVTLI